MMLNVGGFFEHLLDRSTTNDKDGKDRKYGLISSICAQEEAYNLIPGELLKQLTHRKRQYDHCVPVQNGIWVKF